jgi:TrpR-related protein YerC/YecD
MKVTMKIYPSQKDKELIQAFATLKGEKEIAALFRDLLTSAEIEELSRRFHIARLLWTTQLSYLDIAQTVDTSTTTVTRVAQWLYKEPWQGYAVVLKRLYGASQR